MTYSRKKRAQDGRVAVIYNPSAGGGKARRRKWFIEAAFKAHGIPHDLFVTESEAHLVETADAVVREYPVVIGAGGDTTVNLIAGRILLNGTGNTLGIVSMGSVNDMAREMGLHRLKDSLAAVRDGLTCGVDVGVVTSPSRPGPQYFLVSASLGLGVSVNRYVAEWMRRHRILSGFRSTAQQAVALPGIHRAFKNKDVPVEIVLEAGGETQAVLSSLLVFCNISSFAGMFRPSPTAGPFTGSLDCCIFDVSSLAEVLQVSIDIRRRKHLKKNTVRIIQGEVFKIHSKHPLEFQVDGSIVELGEEVEISVLPKALTMFTGKAAFLPA